MDSDRRHFLKTSSLFTAGFLALRGHVRSQNPKSRVDLYGELVPDPEGILDLPPGFSYRVIARTGDEMDDGLLRPGAPDGMAAFPAPGGRVVLVCNHEISNNAAGIGAFGPDYERLDRAPRERIYDFREGNQLHLGGTSTLVYDPAGGATERQFLSLVGTDRNCAGGPTPWGSWITCEEPENMTRGRGARRHGFAFEVPAVAEPTLTEPVPLTEMGRFRREAVAIDPATGIVYQTEDREDGLIYRFIPTTPGRLADGGRLQALAFADRDRADTRNWEGLDQPGVPVGAPVAVRWLDIDDPLSPDDDLRLVASRDKGAAVFARGEGMWFGKGEVYFCCTNGGPAKHGQIWRYRPSPAEGASGEQDDPGTLELFLESNDTNLLEMCDNLTVTPWGDLVICEDGSGEQFVRGIAMDGTVYNLARNAMNNSEFAGACFAPHHPVLFVNIMNPGLTLAVTGPWPDRLVPGA